MARRPVCHGCRRRVLDHLASVNCVVSPKHAETTLEIMSHSATVSREAIVSTVAGAVRTKEVVREIEILEELQELQYARVKKFHELEVREFMLPTLKAEIAVLKELNRTAFEMKCDLGRVGYKRMLRGSQPPRHHHIPI